MKRVGVSSKGSATAAAAASYTVRKEVQSDKK